MNPGARRDIPILVPRGRPPFGHWPYPIFWAFAGYLFRILSQSDFPNLTGSPWIADFRCLCACPKNRVILVPRASVSFGQVVGETEGATCHVKDILRRVALRTRMARVPEVVILGADQKERGLWGREWESPGISPPRTQRPGNGITCTRMLRTPPFIPNREKIHFYHSRNPDNVAHVNVSRSWSRSEKNIFLDVVKNKSNVASQWSKFVVDLLSCASWVH